ncbi:VapE domain-containing protein [Lactococcus garvieae]|uniref:VapE domain-containing protein n=1 Tax=Lactococcus garvieae TaxID=1363 RepID=UPI00398F6613
MTEVDDDFQSMIDSYEDEKAKAESKKVVEKLPHAGKVIEGKFETSNFATNQYGKPKSKSIKNIKIAIEADPILKDKFIFNEFTQEIEIKSAFKLNNVDIQDDGLKDVYVTTILEHFEEKYEVLFDSRLLVNVINKIAYENKYNPVKTFMEECYKSWDKKKRARNLFPNYLGAKESDLTERITKLFFVGAVSKVYNPYNKFDFVLDLVGGQGCGKTTFLEKMGGSWYTDSMKSFDEKDELVKMLRALIVNDDEMSISNKMPFADLKKFITQTVLSFRAPYGTKVEKYAKNFVLARTTNIEEYQKDRTGARRFLPVYCSKELQKYHPVSDLDDATVCQIWGEMVHYYKQGFSFKLSEEEEKQLNLERSEYEYFDEQEELLEQYLEIPIPEDFYKVQGNSTRMHERRAYIGFILQSGETPEHEFKGKIKPREFVTAPYFYWEAMGIETGKGTAKIVSKFKHSMNNKAAWEKVVRKGKRGYKRR